MKSMYISATGNIWYAGDVGQEDITEALLLGKEMFLMLHPGAWVSDDFFETLAFVDGRVFPNYPECERRAKYLMWHDGEKCWQGSW